MIARPDRSPYVSPLSTIARLSFIPSSRYFEERPKLTVMATLKLLHNPHCSTSVHALEALEAASRDVTVRRYLLVAERLDEAELRDLADRLVGDPVDALVRRDNTYKELGLDLDGAGIDAVVATLAANPKLLQRPILDDGTHVVIGRPRSRAEAWARSGRAVTE